MILNYKNKKIIIVLLCMIVVIFASVLKRGKEFSCISAVSQPHHQGDVLLHEMRYVNLGA